MPSLECISPPLVTWWPLLPKTELFDCGHLPCRFKSLFCLLRKMCMSAQINASILYLELNCNKVNWQEGPAYYADWGCRKRLGFKSLVFVVLCTIEKESQRCSKLIQQLYAVLLSPMMATDWWRHPTTSLSKCGVFTGSASSTRSASTPTGCAVPGTQQQHILNSCAVMCLQLIGYLKLDLVFC